MSEELLQRNLLKNPEKIGAWDFYNIGSTTLNELKNAGLIQQKDYKEFGKRKPDGILVEKKRVIAVVENKSTEKFKTKKQKQDALKQGIDVAQVLGAKILILTDTVETIWINVLTGETILDERAVPIKTVFSSTNNELPELLESILDSIDENNSQIREPRLKDPTKLAKSVWQDLWMAAGATPENCLYSFVELFIFKYLSDLGILKDHQSYDFIMDMFTKESEQVVLEYYADTIRKYIKQDLFPITSDDNTTIINGTIFVSKDEKAVEGYGAVFHKILKKFGDEKEGGGELKNIDKEFKSRLFETFLKESISKKNWGQYFTPLKVVRAMVKMAESEIQKGKIICDPACGVGKFLLEPLLLNNNIEHFYSTRFEKDKKSGNRVKKLDRKITLLGMDKGFDKEEQKTIILAKANMLIYLSELIRKNSDITPEFSKLFNETFELKTKNILGSLRDVSYEGKIDLILTNPPYVTTGSSNLKEEIIKSGIQKHYKINAMGVEGLFMEWIVRALKPGGKAFVVVPDGIFNRQNDKNLRKFMLDECIIDGIISLPVKTFFTTPKKTYILCITKKQDASEKQTVPVFTYLVSEIGESRDIYRFNINQDDLTEAAGWFNQFKNAKTAFKFNDQRCKIQPIEKFDPENHWNIERWWSKEEQIKLGIAEEGNTIKFEELPGLLEEVSNNILSLKEELLEISQKKKTEIVFRKVKIGDIFDFPSTNSKITKEYCNKHIGDIPVYASSMSETSVLGYIADDIPSVKYYENCLSWNRNGSVGYVFIRNHKFATNEDHRALVLKKEFEECLSKNFLKYIIELNLFKNGFSFLNKCGVDKIKNVELLIPVNAEGVFDVGIQNKISLEFEKNASIKLKISEYKKQIENLKIDFGKEPAFIRNVRLDEIFLFPSIKGLTKQFIENHKGNIPVYGGKIDEEAVGYIADNISGVKYFENCLAWNREGSVGYVFWHKHKFSTNDHHRPILVKQEFQSFLSLGFLKITLQQLLLNQGFAWSKTASKEKVEKFFIPIPVTSTGDFDLSVQEKIAEKYQKIEQIKKSIIAEMEKITNIVVDFA
jgi:type I restriction-modification system DNA methylase subunit